MRIRLVLFILVIGHFSGFAQVERPVTTPVINQPAATDSISKTALAGSDTLKLPSDSLKVKKKSAIETTINYTANDSIVSSINGKLIWLYGNAKITYGVIELEADEILIDYGNNTVTANGRRDSAGRRIGFPIFKNGSEVYETKDIVYNIKTKRAKISEVVTKQGEGIIHGKTVYKNEKNELLTKDNLYTTCTLEHPHFAIRSTKVKAIPNDKIVSGPFHLEFNDVPIYPAGFAFGMFPAERESKSGIIFPSYGEERRRGFNIRQGGYFFDISEYLKLMIVGDLYSKGGHAIRTNVNYNKRYAYTGSLNFSYSKTPQSRDIEDRSSANDYSLNWSHSPQSKGTGRFSASVNAATSTYNLNNNLFSNNVSPNSNGLNNTQRRMQSNVSYGKTLKGTPFSFGLNASHSQDLITRKVDLLLPSLTVNMNNIYPFQKKSGGKSGPLENFNFRYTMAAQNKINNNLGRIGANALEDSIAAFTPANFNIFWDKGNRGMRHTIPFSTSAKVFKYFTLAPSVQLEEVWYGERLEWGRNEDGAIVKIDTAKVFNRVTSYSGSLSLNTRIYGGLTFKRGSVKAIRHVINPSISYSYRPDFSENENYFQRFVDTERDRVEYKSRHEGFMYGGASIGKNQSMGFSINNNLEMKVKSKDDTVARKVTILNQLSLGSSYNFLADSFKLAPLGLSANTNVLNNKLNINASATLDPYTYQNGRRIDVYSLSSGKLGRITNANIALGTNLNPKGQESDAKTQEKIGKSNMSEADKQYMLNNPGNYVDFSIPWNLRINYNLSYNNTLLNQRDIKQNLQFSGDLSLSEQWKIQFNSGFDFEAKKLTQTNLVILRDLHCWTMSLNWTPFGYFTQYDFRINVKASVLQDLKMERRKPFFDNF
ncbi:putative LPS assembly protein LptD [Chryseotalea sanaruensis]|uniref:putative LPS assembly protein LptD n=1 Tax=Chryseotalea sanaruensis TaxID=2482724 RepID=UPI000F8F80A1|nr:putative LPS assembly protein LptD [Chryseotalea sanaruensis]